MKTLSYSVCLTIILFLWVTPGEGQISRLGIPTNHQASSASKNEASALTPERIEQTIKDLKDRLARSVSLDQNEAALQAGVSTGDFQERISLLQSLQSVYERLLTALKGGEVLAGEESSLKKEIKSEFTAHITQPPPYSLSFYDALLDKLGILEEQKKTAELAVSLRKRALEDLGLLLEKAQKDWRLLKDEIEALPEKDRTKKLLWDRDQNRLTVEHAEALVALEKAMIENHSREERIAQLHIDSQQRTIDLVRSHLTFDEADFQKKLNTLQQKKTELKERIQAGLLKQRQIEAQWKNAQRNLKNGGISVSVGEIKLTALDSWKNTFQINLEYLEDQLRLIGDQEEILRLRYALIKHELNEDELQKKRLMLERGIEAVNRTLNLQQNYQNNLLSEIASLEKEMLSESREPEVKQQLMSQLEAKQTLAQSGIEYVTTLLAAKQATRRILNEIEPQIKKRTFDQRLDGLKNMVKEVWNFEVWAIDTRPVTVRKLIVSLLMIIIGLIVVKYVIRTLGRHLSSYTHLRESTASSISKLFKYLAYLFVLYFALRIVNIPLEAFAFLGGAIAIGIGFGAQNIINNFISGFIIMAEQPINIGDLVEVEGVLGKVEEIGARCTQIRTGENIHILVPNSSFLEKNITNWTFSDRRIRTQIEVGLAYGSPVREAEKNLLQAVGENKKVAKKPEPFVLFRDFGNNALIFEVYFWISINTVLERKMIESDTRFRIQELFQQAGLVIAFPQRDVHLDANQPLEFRLITEKQ